MDTVVTAIQYNYEITDPTELPDIHRKVEGRYSDVTDVVADVVTDGEANIIRTVLRPDTRNAVLLLVQYDGAQEITGDTAEALSEALGHGEGVVHVLATPVAGS